MIFKKRAVGEIADMICGNFPDEESFFVYRSSMFLTEFFADIETNYVHNKETRKFWVSDVLAEILSAPTSSAELVPEIFTRVIDRLMEREDAKNEDQTRPGALAQLNRTLNKGALAAFYAEDGHCYLRQIGTGIIVKPAASPHRPLSPEEVKRRGDLEEYLNRSSEDDLIENVLLPLFRQLGFQRITAAGHKDKALEYGKDIWMKYRLPTTHVLYFGIQVKKGKLDSAGRTGGSNIAEIHNQVLMMLGHEIFDPEIGKTVLVDHAFIVAGGEITKAAKNWLGNMLDNSKRSQILFMDRQDILNLFVVSPLPLPGSENLLDRQSRTSPPF